MAKCITEMHMAHIELVAQTGQNPVIIYGNAMVYQETMLFFSSSVFIPERQASFSAACLIKAWCTNVFENAGHGFQIYEILMGI